MLVSDDPPSTMWSSSSMSISRAHWSIRRVTRMSSGLGVGSPDGWLWTMTIAGRRISATLMLELTVPIDPSGLALCVSVGMSTLATASDGTRYDSQKRLAKMRRAAARSENVHDKNKRSARRGRWFANCTRRITNLRFDADNKAAAAIAAGGVIAVE